MIVGQFASHMPVTVLSLTLPSGWYLIMTSEPTGCMSRFSVDSDQLLETSLISSRLKSPANGDDGIAVSSLDVQLVWAPLFNVAVIKYVDPTATPLTIFALG